jgi:hypothetical protein
VNRERSRAYARVTQTVRELGPAKLLPTEVARIRAAADTLVFARDVVDDPAHAAVVDAYALRAELVASGRWTVARAGRLLDDLWSCGPGLELERAAA